MHSEIKASLLLFVFGSDLLVVSADLDGIWDELGSLLLGHRGNVLQQDGDLNQRAERRKRYSVRRSYLAETVFIDLQTSLLSDCRCDIN